MELRRQRREMIISDENEKSTAIMGKLNLTRNNETKRGILCDIGTNRISTTVGLRDPAAKPVSRLPVPKAGHIKSKSLVASKPKTTVLKENQGHTEIIEAKPSNINTIKSSSISSLKPMNITSIKPSNAASVKSSNVTSIIDKTKTLKIESLKTFDRPPGVEDIDKEDRNPFLLSSYAKDIHEYLRSLEISHPIQEDYLNGRDITSKHRAVLIDWLVEVQQEYHLLQETLHITVGILDSYLQVTEENQQAAKHTDRQHMQLVGIACLFLASKYEEITVPAVEDLVYISASTFKESDLYQMEREVFKTIGFDISRPISLCFLRRYSKAASAQSDQHTYAKYFLELALIEYSLCHVRPSLIAAAALCLALFVTSDQEKADASLWTKTLEYYSGYTFDDFVDIFKKLAKIVMRARTQKHQAVVQKYSSSKFLRVSSHKCLLSEPMRALANSE